MKITYCANNTEAFLSKNPALFKSGINFESQGTQNIH